jgi:hypothetical protein
MRLIHETAGACRAVLGIALGRAAGERPFAALGP